MLRLAVAALALSLLSGCGSFRQAEAREAIPKGCIDKLMLTNKTVCGPTQLHDYFVCDQIALHAECVKPYTKRKKQP